jgi:2-polyprenyl-6-methoxyphenol hydroxylase-like FAD-dependent oxidoreductase
VERRAADLTGGTAAERYPSAVEVLIVGAGPTGLALAVELHAYGVPFRLIDRQLDRVHESRALAIQPRTLEVLARHGLAQPLVDLGNPAVQLWLHAGRRVAPIELFDVGLTDTAYPFLLFLSQAETERVLCEHLLRAGVSIERGVELTGLDLDGDRASCRLRHADGREEAAPATYVVGCDGAHSTVRELAGIGFAGRSYPQTFLLADLEVDGLVPGVAHSYLTDTGILFFFPLGTPATWRMLAIRPPGNTGEVTLAELQQVVDASVADELRLRDPVWTTDFRLHVRGAARYRSGPVFLAGDAAHIHSPAGGQGMNTGIQDSANLGWKLAFVSRREAIAALLDTYEAERAPVGRAVLRLTDRLFTVATTTNPIVRTARTRLLPAVAPVALRFAPGRAAAFRTLSQLNIRYRRSPLSVNGPQTANCATRPGERMPDTPYLTKPGFHLLLCGPPGDWPPEYDTPDEGAPAADWPDLVTLHRVQATLPTQYLVRPDGYVGYRASGTDLSGLRAYLARWLPGPQ